MQLRLKRPGAKELGSQFDEVRRWIRALEEGSKSARGFGYEIEWAEVNHRQLGRNRVPVGVQVPTEADGLRLIQRTREAERFQAAVDHALRPCPELRGWMAERPGQVLEQLDVWERLVAVAAWFREHPRPGIYLRQIDLPGVDTKLIEEHKGVLEEMLDRLLPPGAIDGTASGGRGFERRYGVRSKPALVRFRILDEQLAIAGLTDLSLPADDFARLELPAKLVFITENEINGLAFPSIRSAIVIFGLGYGLERLAEAVWLGRRAVWYWGDLDTHGFAILDKLRATLPHARSLLMDRETLLAHRSQWVQEPTDKRHLADLRRLTVPEAALFEDIRRDRLDDRVRLEQERVSFGWLRKSLDGLAE